MSKRNPVDIIIPIYNAYDDIKKCIDSIKLHTDLTLDRVILINDCSTDERVKPYLESVVEHNMVCLNNEVNAGFSNNVNKGMQYSEDRDVILLNSDTIVTSKWVDKIFRCAYSMEMIGTVTPMSNSATLCSYPITCMDNEIPEHLSVDELAEYVEHASMHKYPRITVAVGFCMFIKRKVIREVGLFDAETFDRGYGEENDFCNRAEQYGYSHVMCDDTFIYHKGTVSFANEDKQRLIDSHNQILEERYPAQMKRNSEYCQENPDKYIRDNIDIYAKADSKKPNLMFVLHSDFRSDAWDNMGGTQFHVRDLVSNLKDKYNIYVVARDRENLRVTLYSGARKVSLKYSIGHKDLFNHPRNPKLYELFDNLLRAFKIDVLHVHHTVGLGFDMVYAAHELDIPVVLTMHDYYYVCPNVKLVNTEGQYCNGYNDIDSCDKCLKEKSGIYIGYEFLKRWRKSCSDMIEMCNEIIVPSDAAKKVVCSYYPKLNNKIKVIEHGTEFNRDKITITDDNIVITDTAKIMYDSIFESEDAMYTAHGWAYLEGVPIQYIRTYLEISSKDDKCIYECSKEVRIDVMQALSDEDYVFSGYRVEAIDSSFFGKSISVRVLLRYGDTYYTDGKVLKRFIKLKEVSKSEFNIAFLGGLVFEKGSKIVIDMIRSNTDNVNWHIFGVIGDDDVNRLEQNNLIKHGAYRQQDLPLLMKQYDIDVVCILPIWPETFCYTISESVLCGIPVFVTDIGAVGERVKRHGYGWYVDVDMEPEKMGEYLINLLKNPEEYNEKKQNAANHKEITLADMSAHYDALYNGIMNRSNSYTVSFDDFDRERIFKGLDLSEYEVEITKPQLMPKKQHGLIYRALRKTKNMVFNN